MELILSSLVPFDENHLDRYVFAGPWCFAGKEQLDINWGKVRYIEDAFCTYKELELAEKITLYYSNKWLERYASERVSPNSKVHPINYFRMIMMPWLQMATEDIYRYYIQAKKLKFDYKL